MGFLDWMKERFVSRENVAQRPEPSRRKGHGDGGFREGNDGAMGHTNLAFGCGFLAGVLVTSDTTETTGFRQPDLARRTRQNRVAETMILEPLAEVFSRCTERATGGLGPRPGNRSFNLSERQLRAFEVMPGVHGINDALPLSETPKAQRDGCHGVAERSHFNKIVFFLKANFMLQGKGCKSGRFASLKTPLRRCQSRPMHCIGETYAPIIRNCSYFPQGCIVGPSLLPLCLVVSGQLFG
jgi:hypothetical protein